MSEPWPNRGAATAGRRWPLSRIVAVAVLALLLFSVVAVVAAGSPWPACTTPATGW